jgi:hypothetical protein
MIAKKEFREEREDVFSFWNDVPTIEDGVIVQVETKLEEVTVIELEKRITDFEQQILELQEKITVEQTKINIIKAL